MIRSAKAPRLEAVGPKLEAREERLEAVGLRLEAKDLRLEAKGLRLEAKSPTVQVSERPFVRQLTVVPQRTKGFLRTWGNLKDLKLSPKNQNMRRILGPKLIPSKTCSAQAPKKIVAPLL